MKILNQKNRRNWQGATALITGASSGIGAFVATKLAQLGMQVILTARRTNALEMLAQQLNHAGHSAAVMTADLSDHADRQQLMQHISARFGKLDVLINNAGFGWYGYYADMPWQIAEQMLKVNTEAVMHFTRLVLPTMRTQGKGHIINIGSLVGGFPNQGVAVYAASKAFLDAFSTSLHREMRGSGVQVSVLRLGPVRTEFFDTARHLQNGRSVPAERFAIPVERAAQAVVNLLEHPRRVQYVPAYFAVIPLFSLLFAGIIDRIGPLLLQRNTR